MKGLLLRAVWALALLAQSLPAQPHDPDLRTCAENLKSLATACELYQTDWGYYPPQLRRLTLKGLSGGYLRKIPSCPAAGQDTYSRGYWVRHHHLDKNLQWSGGTNAYLIRCSGRHHPPLPPYRPEFHFLKGLRYR